MWAHLIAIYFALVFQCGSCDAVAVPCLSFLVKMVKWFVLTMSHSKWQQSVSMVMWKTQNSSWQSLWNWWQTSASISITFAEILCCYNFCCYNSFIKDCFPQSNTEIVTAYLRQTLSKNTVSKLTEIICLPCNCLFPLPESDLDSDSDSDFKPYIVLFRTFPFAWRSVLGMEICP